jgi:N-acetylmuramoyl-L-alanine amidase
MRVVISSGHGKHVSGAVGILDEVTEARKVVDQVATDLRAAGAGVVVYHDDTSKTQRDNINGVVAYHNGQTRDLDVSVHFNAYSKTDQPRGTEVLWLTQEALAVKVAKAIAAAGGFINRGAKKRTDLGFLNQSKKPAILIEVCFVDSSADVALYRANFSAICKAVAEAISGQTIAASPTPPAPTSYVPAPGSRGVVNVDDLQLRAGPGASNKALASLNRSTMLNVAEAEGEWLKVTAEGWVAARYVNRP